MGCQSTKEQKPQQQQQKQKQLKGKERNVPWGGEEGKGKLHNAGSGEVVPVKRKRGKQAAPPPGYHNMDAPGHLNAWHGNGKLSGQIVLALYGGLWYGAVVCKTEGETVDLLWDDGTFTYSFPKEQTYPMSVGTPVEGKWGGEWYPCTILQLSPTVDVQWTDGSLSQGLPPTSLRPSSNPSPLHLPDSDADPDTPTRTGIFGRRSVLVPGADIEIRDREGGWHPGVVHSVGDTCSVEFVPSGVRATVPLTAVRSPPEPWNRDLYE